MSSIVSDIVTAFEGEVATVLPTYAELFFKYDVEKNDYFSNALRFGVIPSAGFNSPTTTKAITIIQSFTLILTNEFINQDDTDTKQQAAVFELYDSLNEIYKVVVPNKLGLPASVFNVEVGTIEAPLFIDESKVVILNTEFLIQYRTPF